MSDSPIPPYVDTRKAFLQEGKTTGFITLNRLPRFVECLASDQGSVQVELSFELSESGKQVIKGQIEAQVEVTCQRCLEPLGIEISDDINLALLKRQEDAEKLKGELDPWVCEDHKLDVANLVEEQLILSLPLVSYHPDKTCIERLEYSAKSSAEEEQVNEQKDNPFAVLKVLKESD